MVFFYIAWIVLGIVSVSVFRHLLIWVLKCVLFIFLLGTGFGNHFSMIISALQSYFLPSDHCDWKVSHLVPHVHVHVRPPVGPSFCSVNAVMPHHTETDHYKRVCQFSFS